MMKYTEVTDALSGSKSILAELGNGVVLSIPCDPANSDYQEYLKSLEAEDSTPMVTDEASTL
jgi:hypothetical protein